jgi:hypothetical protein
VGVCLLELWNQRAGDRHSDLQVAISYQLSAVSYQQTDCGTPEIVHRELMAES